MNTVRTTGRQGQARTSTQDARPDPGLNADAFIEARRHAARLSDLELAGALLALRALDTLDARALVLEAAHRLVLEVSA